MVDEEISYDLERLREKEERHASYRNQAAGAWFISTVLGVVAGVFAGWTVAGVLVLIACSFALLAIVNLIAAA